MASASVVIPPSEIELTIKLNQDEAERLKSMMQNEWHAGESLELGHIRQVIWNALSEAGVASI